jgi:uncharacterized protein YceH (UPF0502 family)
MSSDSHLSLLEARLLGCLIEKEFCTPDLYPLTLNALVNACNQRNNRAPVMAVGTPEVEAALEGLRLKRYAALFSGADARVPKFRQTLDLVHPMEPAARALLAELLLRGPQTSAELRSRSERMVGMPDAVEVEAILNELSARPAGAIVRLLPRQSGQKEARWVQLLTGEPAAVDSSGDAPVTVAMVLPPEVERRLAALEGEVATLRQDLATLRAALGEDK